MVAPVTGGGASKMLFDERPKNNKTDLYDAEEELKQQKAKPLTIETSLTSSQIWSSRVR